MIFENLEKKGESDSREPNRGGAGQSQRRNEAARNPKVKPRETPLSSNTSASPPRAGGMIWRENSFMVLLPMTHGVFQNECSGKEIRVAMPRCLVS